MILLFNNEVFELDELEDKSREELIELMDNDDENVTSYEDNKTFQMDYNSGAIDYYKGWHLIFV